MLSNLHYKDTKGQKPSVYYNGACTIKKEKAGSLVSLVPKRTVCDRKVSMKRRVQLFLVYMKLTK